VLFWAPLGAAILHIVEEFVYPGGFAAWDRRYRPGIKKSITPRFHVIINVLFLIVCYDVGALRRSPWGVPLWLVVTALQFSNAVWHVVGSVRTRSYSPGVLTGLLLYLPLCVYGYVKFVTSRQTSVPVAILAFAVGSSYQLWVGKTLHDWRARRGLV
jgi:hypothetical protein